MGVVGEWDRGFLWSCLGDGFGEVGGRKNAVFRTGERDIIFLDRRGGSFLGWGRRGSYGH